MGENERRVIVTTEHRGVFYGTPEGDTTGEQVVLRDARMAIYWGTTGGILQLAQTGPTERSKIGSTAPRIELRGITAVIDVSLEAAKAWDARP